MADLKKKFKKKKKKDKIYSLTNTKDEHICQAIQKQIDVDSA